MKIPLKKFAVCFAIFASAAASAGEADVVKAECKASGDSQFICTATVRHGDEGWNHYADRWEILSPDGEILAVRVLAHPHENEQPFARSLSTSAILPQMKYIVIRARDSVHGFGGVQATVKIAE